MSEQGEGGEVVSFIAEQFRRLNARFDLLEKQVDERFNRLEDRLLNLEKRQSASTHFEQSVLAHLASIHDSVDALRGEMISIDRRVTALEKR